MYDLNTQSAAAVIEAEVPQVSTPELVEPPVEVSVDASTQQAVNDNAVENKPAEVIEQPESQAHANPAHKAFTPHESLNLVVNRRANSDDTYEFYIANEGSDWLHKHGNFTSGSPIGIEETKAVIGMLAEETHEFLTVLDSVGDSNALRDEGDMKNLAKLRDYIAQIGDVTTLLTKGIRYISVGSRLITNAKKATDNVVSGLISISYQIEGEKSVMKYRLVGQMSRELVLKLADIGGPLVHDVVPEPKHEVKTKPKAEVKEKPAKKNKGEKPSNQYGANHDRAPHDNAYALHSQMLDAVNAGNRNTQRLLQEIENQGDHNEGRIEHLTEMMEALVVDNRELNKKMESMHGFSQALQREVRETRKVNTELLETNQSLTKTLVLILDKLNK